MLLLLWKKLLCQLLPPECIGVSLQRGDLGNKPAQLTPLEASGWQAATATGYLLPCLPWG